MWRRTVHANIISNGNRTEWSPINFGLQSYEWDRAAGVRCFYYEYDYRPNWTTQSRIIN